MNKNVLNDKNSSHESFEIELNKIISKKLIRQERIHVKNNLAFLVIDKMKFEIQNYSPFGLAILSNNKELFSKDNEIQNALLLYSNFEIGILNLRVVHIIEENKDSYNIGMEVVGEPINLNLIQAINLSNELILEQISEVLSEKNISDSFKSNVLELRDWLELLKKHCGEVDSKLNWEFSDVLKTRDNISIIIGSKLLQELKEFYNKISNILKLKEVTEVEVYVSYLRKKLSHLIYLSPLAERAYKKPLGYAGDYQMMNIVYDNQNAGLDLFSKCMHQCFVQEGATKAVWNRSYYLKSKIKNILTKKNKEKNVSILSLACGPAREIELLLNEGITEILKDRHLEVHLIDQDENALQDAQIKIQTLIRRNNITNINVTYHNLAIKNIIVRGLNIGKFDLIYSAGLFDYLSNPVAIATSKKLFSEIKDDGELIIGNFDITNPSQRMMEIIMDWQLIYRSKEDLISLYSHLNAPINIEEESEKINLFAVINKSLR